MITRQTNWLGQQRVDVPHLRAAESSVAADFDILAGQMLAGKQALILKGFNVITTGAIGAPATNLKVRIADGLLMHYQASESGSVFWAPSTRADEQLSNNTKVTGSFTSSQTNYIGLDLSRNADDATSDNVQFLEPVADSEVSKVVPLARTLDVRFIVTAQDFSSQSTVLPLAKVIVDANGNVTSIQDARSMMFRLGSGGDAPNIQNAYPWPGTRYENTTGDVFAGGDKSISDLKTWINAVMTRMWEIGGGEYWYSSTADRNVNMVWIEPAFSNGENFEVVSSNVHWKGLRFLFDNSTSFANDVQDQTGNSAGLTDMANGDCLYVDLDRTKFRCNPWASATVYAVGDLVNNDSGKAYMCRTGGTSAGSGGPTGTGSGINDNGVIWDYVGLGANRLIAQKAPLITMGSPLAPGSRQVVAWMVGGSLYTRGWRYPVGTLFIPATYTSQGVVKISRDYLGNDASVSGLDNPVALSDRGGVITTPTISKVGLIIKRFDSGVDIQEWQTASGTTLIAVDNSGAFNAPAKGFAWKGNTALMMSLGSNFGDAVTDLIFTSVSGGPSSVGFEYEIGATTFRTISNLVPYFDIQLKGHNLWRFSDDTGALMGLGTNRPIQNVLDPVNAQDAATKNYADTVTPKKNIVINGNMQIAQRSTGPFNPIADHVGSTMDRIFICDRWTGLEDVSSTTNTGNDQWAISQQSSSLPNTPFCLRQTYITNSNTTSGFLWAAQEIDRDLLALIVGKKLSLSVTWRKGSAMADSGEIRIITQTGTAGNAYVPSGFSINDTMVHDAGASEGVAGAYSGNATALSVTVANGSLSTSFTTMTATTSAVIPTNVTGMVILIGRALSNSTAGSNNYLDITAVNLCEGSVAPTSFAYAGGNINGEIGLCQRYYEKSDALGSSPNANLNPEMSTVIALATSNGTVWPLGHHPTFQTRKRIAPKVGLAADLGHSSNQWTIPAVGPQNSTAISICDTGFQIANNTGGSITPTAGLAFGTWIARAEI